MTAEKKKKIMNSAWNVLTEIRRRESGFRNSIDFLEKINATHFVGESYKFVGETDFNSRGDLLCSTRGSFILVYDWANNELKHKFDSGMYGSKAVKFLNYGDNNFEILAARPDSTIVRYSIASTGLVKSSVYNNTYVTSLTSVPKNPFEVICVNDDGAILQLDLRTSQTVAKYVSDGFREPIMLNYVDHHPFATEICVGGYQKCLRIYDTRNLKKEMFKFSIPHLPIPYGRMRVLKCLYNYNGTEILANNSFVDPEEEDRYCDHSHNCLIVFKNKIHDSGNIIVTRKLSDAAFFGPKSEYVIDVTGKVINFHYKGFNIKKIGLSSSGYEHERSYVKPHPFLSVFASTSADKPITIWAPTNK